MQTPVLIVGGGPVGLFLSTLLSSYKVPSTLIEARTPAQIAKHPQAHYINLRTMEILYSSMPNVYNQVIEQMPKMEETNWDAFNFSHSVTGRQIARVLNPVKGIAIGQNSHGKLVKQDNEEKERVGLSETNEIMRCSPCDPGHLPQNIFTSILLDEAQRAASLVPQSRIIHGMNVNKVTEEDENETCSDYPLSVHTSCSKDPIIQAKYVIVAEGSSSSIRQQWNCKMVGKANMQSLMNVHFRTSQRLTKRLMEKKESRGMLHFVFHQDLVGAFVCHGPSEWVLQFPFFAPFQEVDDFSVQRVKKMILAGLVDSKIDPDGGFLEKDLDVLTIRPWTMSSTVAQSYFLGNMKRILLAGDAAHAFPPSGGFGMNTGLQDSHNLAWRLAIALKKDGHITPKRSSHNILEAYEMERKHIAVQNAALSVRNYNRTLEIAKSCWLYAQHPMWLTQLLQSMNMIMSHSIQRGLFETAVKTAMLPLSNLATKGNLYGDQIARRMRQILHSGGGLPLLFPNYEIGFSYDVDSLLSERDDTAGYYPDISVGKRLCHVPMERVVWRGSATHVDQNSEVDTVKYEPISLIDIESRLSGRWELPQPPKYLLIAHEKRASVLVESFVEELMANKGDIVHDDDDDRPCLDVKVAEVYADQDLCESRVRELEQESLQADTSRNCYEESENFTVVLYDVYGTFHDRISRSSEGGPSNVNPDIPPLNGTTSGEGAVLLVRPDGHIANIWKTSEVLNDTTFKEDIMASLKHI